MMEEHLLGTIKEDHHHNSLQGMDHQLVEEHHQDMGHQLMEAINNLEVHIHLQEELILHMEDHHQLIHLKEVLLEATHHPKALTHQWVLQEDTHQAKATVNHQVNLDTNPMANLLNNIEKEFSNLA